MRFKKGNTYGKGRPKGSKNKNTQEIRQFYTDFLHKNLSELEEAFKELDAREKFKYLIEMTKFVIPALRSISGTIDDLTEEQFEAIVSKIKEEHEIPDFTN